MWKSLVVLCLGIGLVLANRNGPVQRVAPTTILLTPPAQLKFFALGYNEPLADSLWIRVIQDFDICEQAGVATRRVYKNDFPTRPSESSQGQVAARRPKCNKGWVFHMLMAISELAPRFRTPLTSGAIMLSVITDDISGATILFERGLRLITDDWEFTYRAAYHFLVEVNDLKRASELLVQAGHQGAPEWVFLLAARLMSKEGQIALAKSVLEEQIRTQTDPKVRAAFEQRLAEVQARITASPEREGHPAQSRSQ